MSTLCEPADALEVLKRENEELRCLLTSRERELAHAYRDLEETLAQVQRLKQALLRHAA